LFLLSILLSGVVLADVACVRNIRAVNDNFYVLNRKTAAPKPTALPEPGPPVTSRQLSNSKTEGLAVESDSSPRPKSSLSNVGILEQDNPRISSLLREAQIHPGSASIRYQLGRAYHDFRLYDEALRYYQIAVQLEPNNPLYYEQTARLWRDWGSLELGVDLAKKALALNPEFVEAWNTLGTILDQQGKSKSAQDAYLQALSLNQDLDYVHSNLCFSYLQTGEVEQAIHHGQRAVHLNPTLVVAHNHLGIAYGMQGKFARSLEEFKLSGDEAAARNNLGLMLLKQGYVEASMEQFKLASRLKPYFKEAMANYRLARDLSSQRARQARARLRLFDSVTQTEPDPGMLGLVAIEDLGLGRLDLDLLCAHSFGPPRSPLVN
jgi:tetratricopeptide (TPR) repeat protein